MGRTDLRMGNKVVHYFEIKSIFDSFFYFEIRNRKIYIKKKARSEKKRTLFYILNLSIRGDPMKNVTDSFISLDYWPSAGSFGFNTDILATNPINLSVVLGGLIFFGKGVCASCLFQE
jgi:hypothetical protein